MHQWHFNLLTAYALGQEGLGELALCIRTVYYNRERLLEYEAKTGCNDTATFRRKGEEDNQGYVFNVAETCSPANPVQLLTDIALYQNTISDEAIAAERIPDIKERTNLGEMIVDAGFTDEVSEEVCETEGCLHRRFSEKGFLQKRHE